jgi:DNA invertase Pin-like site-specific DNA recombinase
MADTETVAKVARMYNAGAKTDAIARACNCSRAYIYKLRKRYPQLFVPKCGRGYTQDVIRTAIEMVRSGMGKSEVARRIGCNRTTIYVWLRECA